MELLLAKNAGFCFGVKNAIDKAINAAEEEGRVFTYGPIIHNESAIKDLESKGINIARNLDDIHENDVVIIRSHGISKKDYENLNAKGARIIDATCLNVKRIHEIVHEKSSEGYKIVIVGDPNHPEVIGVNGWCDGKAIIINDENDCIEETLRGSEKICVVAQTTYNVEKWYSILSLIVKCAKEVIVFNTICSSTKLRQDEAKRLSKEAEAVIIVGGKESSNSRKLYEICKENCTNSLFIENAEELDLNLIKGLNKIALTAGASTPEFIVEKVIEKIKTLEKPVIKQENNAKVEIKNKEKEAVNMNNYDESMNDYLSTFKEVYEGTILQGKVLLVNEKEVFFDIGYKADAIMPLEEASNTPIDLLEKFKVGDEVEIQVVKMNDGEGNVVVSRKSLEKEEFYESLKQMKNNGEIIEAVVEEVNKGGYNCKYNNVRCFMPFSLSGVRKGEDENQLVGKKVKVTINDCKEGRNGIELLISRREILQQEREEKQEELFKNIKAGDVINGTVKGIINNGAFVNIGACDVFIPISEISWKRIPKVGDVLSLGQNVSVLLTKINLEDKRITGSIKRLGKEPWEEFIEQYNVDDVTEGKVIGFANFGAFIEVANGVVGLAHISQMSDRRINKPQDVAKLGQIIKVRIINIDNENRKVSFSMKDIN